MTTIVAKFGGSSVSDANAIRQVAAILAANPARRFVVSSAPGKRHGDDVKVTDLLYQLYALRKADYTATLTAIRARFIDIATDLGVSASSLDFDTEFDAIEEQLVTNPSRAYLASRGEYLQCKLIAAFLGWEFIDAAEVIRFSKSGELLAVQTDEALARRLRGVERAVIPGFYGAAADGSIKTFSRGGSDVTGALVARVVDASTYENWTDVPGIMMADPRIVDQPRTIERLSYTALRELTYLGASVLHEDAITPVRERGIPINIRNTFDPQAMGTWVQTSMPVADPSDPAIIGLAGKQGYTTITLRKPQWSGMPGVSGTLFDILGQANLVLDLALTSIDGWTVAVSTEAFAPVRHQVMGQIKTALEPATIEIENGLSLLGVVSSGACSETILTGQVSAALSDDGIEILSIFRWGDLHLITVNSSQYQQAVRALYGALVAGRA
ncbi:MAG: aspartate kinase [Propionibacteriaceae bacterium]|jgi:aspartate kinase|nr:aspartate kinase [Propionibacteriaceae bacterium]